jgi:type IV secretory pathway VirB2 component (pilin)
MKNMIIGLSVKAVTALETGRNWAETGKMTHRKAFILGMVAAMGSMADEAFAEDPGVIDTANPITQVQKTVCTVAKTLQGPIGVAVIIGCVVIAGLSMAFGGKNSTSLLISALIGGAVVFGAKALLGVVAGGSIDYQSC